MTESRTFLVNISLGEFEVDGAYVELHDGYVVVYDADEKEVAMFNSPSYVIPKRVTGQGQIVRKDANG